MLPSTPVVWPHGQWLNEFSFQITFAASPSLEVSRAVAAGRQQLLVRFSYAIADIVPAYTQLLVVFKPRTSQLLTLANELMAALSEPISWVPSDVPVATLVIPVCYDLSVAPDLEAVAAHANLLVDEVVQLHSTKTYRVCALGFAPGFAYLGFLDSRICMARKATPRLQVAQGSVGIADNQTGVYPRPSPGGWQIIGRTPRVCFDPSQPLATASPFQLGLAVQFAPMSLREYTRLATRGS